ncbi:hypothetical protein ACFQ0T_10260 [Kitasatospora gansuensis]
MLADLPGVVGCAHLGELLVELEEPVRGLLKTALSSPTDLMKSPLSDNVGSAS